jgi:hypothetical protein
VRSLVSILLFAAACGPLCDRSSKCALTGHGSDVQLCDGSDFRSCGDGNRGQVVTCDKSPQEAVCAPSGWAFQNNESPDGAAP